MASIRLISLTGDIHSIVCCLSLSSLLWKPRNLYVPRDCLLSRDCLCTNGGIGGCHLAIVTRCQTVKAVVDPFINGEWYCRERRGQYSGFVIRMTYFKNEPDSLVGRCISPAHRHWWADFTTSVFFCSKTVIVRPYIARTNGTDRSEFRRGTTADQGTRVIGPGVREAR